MEASETLSLTQNTNGKVVEIDAKLTRGQASPEHNLTSDQVNTLFAQSDAMNCRLPQGFFPMGRALQFLKSYYIALGKKAHQFALPAGATGRSDLLPMPMQPRLIGNIMVFAHA